MHQFTTPSLSQTIWPRWASRQFIILPMAQTLLPATFGYSLSSEAVVMNHLRRLKRLWRKWLTSPHKKTSMGPSRSCKNGTSALQPVKITSKWLELHVCTINKSAHTKKVWKLIAWTSYIYIYIYIYNIMCFFFNKKEYTYMWQKIHGYNISSYCNKNVNDHCNNDLKDPEEIRKVFLFCFFNLGFVLFEMT